MKKKETSIIVEKTKALSINDKMLMLLLAAIILLAFSPCLSAGFLNWDDHVYLLDNRSFAIFRQEWSWETIVHFFTKEAIGNYIPLTNVTYAIEIFFCANDSIVAPFIFHFDNVLLHTLTSIFVYVLFRKMGLKSAGAFIGALIFGIHPMRVESVAWVTERKDVLYGFFFFLSLIAYFNYVKADKNKNIWYAVALVVSVLAYLSKIQAVTIPLSMVAIDMYIGRKFYTPKILLKEKLPWWILSVTFGVINVYILAKQKILNDVVFTNHYRFAGKLAIGAYSYTVYLIKFIWPYKLLPYYPYPTTIPLVGYILLVTVPFVIFCIVIYSYKKKYNHVLFGVCFFTFNVMFMLQIVSAGPTFLVDRYTYVAYGGLTFIVAYLFEYFVLKYSKWKKMLSIIFGTYIVLLVGKTYAQAKTWQNDENIWNNYKVKAPNDFFGYYKLGCYYLDGAIAESHDPGDGANMRSLTGLVIENMMEAKETDSISGRHSNYITGQIYKRLGVAFALAGRRDTAVAYFSSAIRFYPKDWEMYSDRGLTYFQMKKCDESIRDYTELLKLEPNDAEAYFCIARCKAISSNNTDGLTEANKAVQLDSSNFDYHALKAKIDSTVRAGSLNPHLQLGRH